MKGDTLAEKKRGNDLTRKQTASHIPGMSTKGAHNNVMQRRLGHIVWAVDTLAPDAVSDGTGVFPAWHLQRLAVSPRRESRERTGFK